MTMNPNLTGYPALQQQHYATPILAAAVGYPAPSPSPNNIQVPFHPNAMPPYSQGTAPPSFYSIHHQQPRLHPQSAFTTAMTMHTCNNAGGALMSPGISQQSSGPHTNMSFSMSPYPHTTIPTTTTQLSLPPVSSTLTANQMISQNLAPSQGAMFSVQQRPSQPPSNLPSLSALPQAQAAAREKARISTLLDINSALLQEVVNLQAAGKAGGPPAQAGSHQPSPTQEQGSASPILVTEQQTHAIEAARGPGNKTSAEYLDCMRRLQTNLAYLLAAADRGKKPGAGLPPTPIMTPPPNLPSVNGMYARLNELFPGAGRGTAASAPQPSKFFPPATMQGNGGVHPVSASDYAV